jgi:hypothetical protein
VQHSVLLLWYPGSNEQDQPDATDTWKLMNSTLKSRQWAYKLFYILLLFIPQMVTADNNQTEVPAATAALPVMPDIHVEAVRIAPTAGMTIIDREMIESLPGSNGNLTELLQTVPGVQFSEDFENSNIAGEIRPAEISIAGGRPEDNNYILDGTGNNSLLDPAYTNILDADNIPGHSQELFILDHLIDDIRVLRANIPVRYGGFSGGVIDTETINPEAELGGQISFDMTRSAWGKFHIDPDDKESFYNSTDASNQPKFTKYRTNTTLSIPLNEKMGLLFDYALLHSKIPLELVGEEKVQYRKNENIFLKFVATPQSRTEIKLSATYAPYEGTYYLKDTLSSDYTLIGGGWRLNGQLNQQTNKGQMELNLNFQESHNSREAPADKYSWWVTPSKDWGTLAGITRSMEGGYGNIEKQQKSFTTNIHFESNPISIKTTTHQINTGFELSHTQATFDRTETSVEYLAWLADGSSFANQLISCSPNDPECIDGEQFIYQRNVRPEDSAKAQILNLNAYIENVIKKERLTLRPGVRASYNNFQENTDLAPRLTTSIDIWNNSKTILIGGVGRYFNTNLLTLKLEEQKKPFEIYRRSIFPVDGEPEVWPEEPRPRTSIPASRTSNLKTPYSDEWSIGLQQKAFGGLSEIVYINRNYKDQIISVILDKDENYFYKEWRNSGRRKYEELSLSWRKEWSKHFLSLNISWQNIKSNSSSYADIFNEHQIKELPDEINYVWYDEKLMQREELPPNNFNRPIKASLIYTAQLAYGFSFSNTTNYRGRYKALLRDGTDQSGLYDAYAVSTVPSALIFDWKIAWASPDWKGNRIEYTLDILNVFDRKIHYGPEDNDYLLGRQFWAGITYNF